MKYMLISIIMIAGVVMGNTFTVSARNRMEFIKSLESCVTWIAVSYTHLSVGDVLRALEGDLRPVDCLAIKDENKCSNADLCITKYVWTRISESINDTVNNMTLQDLLDQNKNIKTDERICDCGL